MKIHFMRKGLVISTVFLTLLGLIMIYSSSWVYSDIYYGNSYYILLKQAIAAVIGAVVFTVCARMDYHFLIQWSEVWLLLGVLATALTLIPSLSSEGRWIDLGLFTFQPTEALKFGLILWVTRTVHEKGRLIRRNFIEGILPFFVVTGIISLFTLSQPDFSMTMLYVSTVFVMLFLAGAHLKDLGKVVLAALPLLGGLMVIAPYRFERLVSFLQPSADKLGSGYQLLQSLTAIGAGGVFGRGLGQSVGKLFYVPSAYNDFIYSIIGEELGFVGAVLVLGLFCYLGYLGLRLAVNTEDPQGKLLAGGITFVLVFQAFLNFCVTLGLVPVTGLTLPFVSYGGSSLIVTLAMVGTLVSIARQ